MMLAASTVSSPLVIQTPAVAFWASLAMTAAGLAWSPSSFTMVIFLDIFSIETPMDLIYFKMVPKTVVSEGNSTPIGDH